jgi:hypothetical protein
MPLAIWLDGLGVRFDAAAMRQACADVAARHDVLATVVRDTGGEVCLGTAALGPSATRRAS